MSAEFDGIKDLVRELDRHRRGVEQRGQQSWHAALPHA